ncbi:hypothetical protein B4Q13_21370, partial [Lacticaseibacillus rhamnosus]
MKKTAPGTAILLFVLCLAPRAFAQDLKLVPEPREVEKGPGAFLVNAKTRIIVNAAHAQEDHTAAEMLAEEVGRVTGGKATVATARSRPKANVIYLARVGDDAKVAGELATHKLAIDDR